ncbi:MAG TPA: fatty acyl-AMP ligase [Streptosporangiaceae bacterium]
MAGYEGLVGTIMRNAARTPSKPAVVFCQVRGGACAEQVLSYGQLDRKARTIAAWLQARFQPGDRIMLLYAQGLDFVTSFLGCLYGGMVPIAAPIPRYKAQAGRAAAIARDAQVSMVLTDDENLPHIDGWLNHSDLAGNTQAAVGLVGEADPGGWTQPRLNRQTLAFLQYTSGSTSTPRGVMVSHGNVEHNIRWMSRVWELSDEQRFCSWLPTFHDMGLILMLLCPLYVGSTIVLLSPTDFLRRPQVWLQLIDRHNIAVSGAPDFAYQLCMRKLTDADIDQLDLSGWSAAINGSEPIDASTLDRFARRFSRAGFRHETFAPGYGLAEATLCVSGATAPCRPVVRQVDAESLERNEFRAAQADDRSQALVSSGQTCDDLDVRIVDPNTLRVLPDGQIGEIWVKGDSVAEGYWRQPEETERTFRAVTAHGDGPYLRTGDLGVISLGELFVTGRIKDMMIVRGRNLYPHDIEREIRTLDAEFAERISCAFSVPAPHEEIVVIQEVRRANGDTARLDGLAKRIRQGLWNALEVRVAGVVLVKPGGVVKTTSGKIQHASMREMFRNDEIDPLYEDLDEAIRSRFRGRREEIGLHPARLT